MPQDPRLEALARLSWLEELRKHLFESAPSIVLPPPRTEADIYLLQSIAAAHNVTIEPWQMAELLATGVYSGVTTEQQVRLDRDNSISAMLHPRYMGKCMHTQECFELICICQGTAQQIICGKTMELHCGDICIIAPGVMHDIQIFSNCVAVVISIRYSSFDRSFFKLFAESDVLYIFFYDVLCGGGDYPYVLFRTGTDESLIHLILDILDDCIHPQPYSSQFRFSCISMLFLRLLRDHSSQISIGKPFSPKNVSIVPVLQYMQANCGHVSRASVAEAFHYNESYFSRMVKKATGQSFYKLLTDIRLAKAQELLCESSLPISEMTRMVGLSSTSNFHKLFREKYGQSPGSYRKQNHNARTASK